MNPHGAKLHWILSPARLPVPPLRREKKNNKKSMEKQKKQGTEAKSKAQRHRGTKAVDGEMGRMVDERMSEWGNSDYWILSSALLRSSSVSIPKPSYSVISTLIL